MRGPLEKWRNDHTNHVRPSRERHRPAASAVAADGCKVTWPGSTASRWPGWPGCSARWPRYLLYTGLLRCTAPTPPWKPACHPASSLACSNASSGTSNTVYWATAEAIAVFLQVVAGADRGVRRAPVLARELETAPSRYAWTQGTGRARWTHWPSWCRWPSSWPAAAGLQPCCSPGTSPGVRPTRDWTPGCLPGALGVRPARG